MSKYTAMSFNQLRAEASKAGFKGTNPKRQDLEAFLLSHDAPSVGQIEPPKVSSATTKVVVAAPQAQVQVSAGKRTYTTVGRDTVKARRAVIAEAASSFISASTAGFTQAKIFDAVCSAAGVAKTPTAWNDLSLALDALVTQGAAVAAKADKKRKLWNKA